MGHERWFRGQQDGQGRPFDWRAQARQHGIPERRARALYEQAVQQARGAAGSRVQELYLALLSDARPDAWRPAPGKVTRTMRLEAERAGKKRSARVSSLTGQPIAPGQVTLTSYLARSGRDPRVRERSSEIDGERTHLEMMRAVLQRPAEPTRHAPDVFERTLDALLGTRTATSQEAWAGVEAAGEAWTGEDAGEESWAGDEPRTDAMNEEAWPAAEAEREAEHLPEATRARMERAFGHSFDDVIIHVDSPEATGATRALTRGREIHFRAGTYEPGTAEGDRLIAHELAHVVQQTARPGQSAGRRALEHEADRAAGAILAGQRAAVSLGASMGAALAFSDSEDHDVEEDAPTPASPDATGAATGVAAGEPATGAADATPASFDATGAAAGAAAAEPVAGATDTATETSAGPDVEGAEADDGNDAALLAEIRTPVAAEGGPAGGGGGGGGGGGEAVPVEVTAPEVSGTPPEQGLAALQGVRPDKLAGALDGVRTAASSEVSQERSALATDPPQQMSTGDAAAAAAPGPGGPDGAGVAAGEDTAAAGQPGRPDAAAVGEEPQAAQGAVANADTTAASNASPPPVAAVSAPVIDNAPADENNARGGISEADAGRMSTAIASVPTHDPHANADPGPAPELAMSEDARAGAQSDRDSLDTAVTDAGTTAATHIAQPMGEDHIDVTLAPETLKAQLAAGETAGAAGAAVAGAGKALGAAKAEALGDAGESAAIIAQLEKGAEIDAALATAQGQVAAERQAHVERGGDVRARADQEIAALRTQSEADQEQARTDARAEVEQARTDWQAEVDTQTEAARTEADAEVKTGLSDIEAEQSNANSEAERHIDEGREGAEEEQKKGEDEAERVKNEKENESSGGFFGWLASKAKAFFDGLKQAISDVLDAARSAIKRVIDVAKRLAVQVIEAARKAIVATIKAVGKALIAIGDRLLAAFPALRERFRATIQGFVDQAVEAVNALAESLKENVQKALDLLGKGLDAALGLLERGLHAIVDGVNAVAQGAISFAKGVVEALGAFAVLIKDIAGDPGGWLGKLGASVMDGIQNHLWGALKTAALAWFQSKVLELLGVGGMVVQLLMEGGIDLGQITNMAWEALQSAIPVALITILVEKLVSMIVPAAGAVMAIIEGLQAAWGTVSRIIAAFGAFVAFLKAIKGGGAGPQFATLLAAAAVVVLDFVASWLLRKLASAARKVGAKLKNLAQKFMKRRQARKGPRKRESGDDANRPRQPDDHARGSEKQKKDEENRKILDKAKRELPPKIRQLTRQGVKEGRLKTQLAAWRSQYRLSSLSIQGSGKNFRIIAKVNPMAEVGHGVEIDEIELLRFIEHVAQEILDSERAKADAKRITKNSDEQSDRTQSGDLIETHQVPAGVGTAGLARATLEMDRLKKSEGRAAVRHLHLMDENDEQQATVRQQKRYHPGLEHQLISHFDDENDKFVNPERYRDIGERFKQQNRSGASLVAAMNAFNRRRQVNGEFSAGELASLHTLLYSQETIRNKRSLIHTRMAMELLRTEKAAPADIFGDASKEGLHPMTPVGAQGRTRMLDQFVSSGTDVPVEDANRKSAAKERFARQQMNREVALIKQWIQSLDLVFSEGADMNTRKEELKQQIRARLLRSFEKMPHI